MAERPNYIKCVATGIVGENVSWCGRRLYAFEWHFMDASHAALNGRAEGRLLTCPECAKAIGTALGIDVDSDRQKKSCDASPAIQSPTP